MFKIVCLHLIPKPIFFTLHDATCVANSKISLYLLAFEGKLAVLISNIPRTAMLLIEMKHSELEFNHRGSHSILIWTVSHR